MQFACLIAAQQQCMQFVLLHGLAAAMHAALVLDDRPTGTETMVSGSVFFTKRKKEVLRSRQATSQKLVNYCSYM